MRFDLVLTSGLDFEEHEEHLAFRFRFLNAVMLTSIAFSALFIILNWTGVNDLGAHQLLATQLHCATTTLLMILLRGRKPYFKLLCSLYVAQSLATFVSALLFVENDELRVVWFYIHIWVVFILLGKQIGALSTVAFVVSLLVVNQHLAHPFSGNAITTALIGLVATGVISYAYASRSMSYFDRLTENNLMLRELASKDPLTGILNPGAYYEVASRMIRLAHRAHTVFSVLFIDLDHFKHINDRCGHETGDAVLRTVAKCLGSHIRDSDILGRIGGEEFSVFLPETDLEGAERLAEKLRTALEQLAPEVPTGECLCITASIGVVQNRPEDLSIADILRRADKAMYLAKTHGRNRVVATHHDDEFPVPAGYPGIHLQTFDSSAAQ